jgi:putative ubiquitin-RnfH superfamily antitoxin RatB of RatAB toxin-antitoxin module
MQQDVALTERQAIGEEMLLVHTSAVKAIVKSSAAIEVGQDASECSCVVGLYLLASVLATR